jgi:hypothetical protein
MIQYHGAEIKKGKLKFFNREATNIIGSMPDGVYLVAVMSMNPKDTRDNQNRYFVQLGEWSLTTGWTKEDLHDLVKEEFFTELFGEELSTTQLDQDQWTMVFFQLENFLLRKFENK